MSISQSAILEKKHSLQRAPPPKSPANKLSSPLSNTIQNKGNPGEITHLIPSVKLRKTGFRDSLIAEDVDNKNTATTDGPTNELQSTLARMRAKFEHTEEEEVKPKPKPKPKPRSVQENIKQLEDKENETKQRSGSCNGDADESKNILTDSNKIVVVRDSRGEPKLCNLPTLESLGKPPSKCPKPGHLVKLLEKYDSKSIVMAPRRNTLSRPINMNGVDNSIAEENGEGEDYDDVDEDLKAQILSRNEAEEGKETAEEEGIMEENYDDVDEMKEKVEEINNASAQNPEPICEENYDDLDTVAEQARDQLQNDFATGGDEVFGEEMYDAVGGKIEAEEENDQASSDSPVENRFSPSAIPSPHKEKGKKDLKKELENQKKREREEQKRRKEEEKRREREEREEKKRKEEEKKRKEEEKKKREQKDKELRKKHKLKPGTEGNGVGEAKSDFHGDGKFELPVKMGDTLVIISEKGCPQGKWLVKNSEGHLGYIPTEHIQLKIDSEGNRMSAIITEDFYEDVDQYQGQGGGQIEEEDDDQEIYDDIAGQEPIDEDLYEELPADQ